MTTLDTLLMFVGLGLIGLALCSLNRAVGRLQTLAGRQAVQIAQLELDVKVALALARKRLVSGRSGR